MDKNTTKLFSLLDEMEDKNDKRSFLRPIEVKSKMSVLRRMSPFGAGIYTQVVNVASRLCPIDCF